MDEQLERPVVSRVARWLLLAWVIGLLISAFVFIVRPVDADSALHATWDCGSVLQPKRFGVPEFGSAPQDALLSLVAGQAACAEERAVQLGHALQLVLLSSFGLPVLWARRDALMGPAQAASRGAGP